MLSAGGFDVPDWDKASLELKRKELGEIANLLPDSRGMFGIKEDLNPVMHLLGAAYGWGGLPEADASYDIAAPTENDPKSREIHLAHASAILTMMNTIAHEVENWKAPSSEAAPMVVCHIWKAAPPPTPKKPSQITTPSALPSNANFFA